MAIGLEKDSIIFYNEMARFVRETDRMIVSDIINDERRHVAKLWELKTKLAAA
jgi:rubrerythrin